MVMNPFNNFFASVRFFIKYTYVAVLASSTILRK